MDLGQYDGLGEYCDPHTASEVFLILIPVSSSSKSFPTFHTLSKIATPSCSTCPALPESLRVSSSGGFLYFPLLPPTIVPVTYHPFTTFTPPIDLCKPTLIQFMISIHGSSSHYLVGGRSLPPTNSFAARGPAICK